MSRWIGGMITYLRARLRCLQRGHKFEFVRNVHGDRALMLGCRSIWRCSHCGKPDYRDYLHTETP